jgi:plastocyanin
MFWRQAGMQSAVAMVIGLLSLTAYSSGIETAAVAGSESSKATQQGKATKRSRVIVIDKFLFQPQALSVRVGQTVEWKNAGSVPHTATSIDGKAFDSAAIPAGKSWRFKAVKKGTFDYVCTLHPNMKGKLIVQ